MRSVPALPLCVVFGVSLAACAVGTANDSTVIHHGGDQDASASFGDDAGGSAPVLPSDDAGSQQQPQNPPQNTPDASTSTSNCSFSGTLATFDFTGQPGNQASTPATSTATDVTASGMTRSSALTATSGLDSMNSSAWTMSSSIDSTRYYTVTLTPSSGCTLDISSVAITTKSSSTGPTQAAIATSDDKFTKATSVAPNTSATASLSVSGAAGAVEVRVYGFAASSTSGTMRVDGTLTISGALN